MGKIKMMGQSYFKMNFSLKKARDCKDQRGKLVIFSVFQFDIKSDERENVDSSSGVSERKVRLLRL